MNMEEHMETNSEGVSRVEGQPIRSSTPKVKPIYRRRIHSMSDSEDEDLYPVEVDMKETLQEVVDNYITMESVQIAFSNFEKKIDQKMEEMAGRLSRKHKSELENKLDDFSTHMDSKIEEWQESMATNQDTSNRQFATTARELIKNEVKSFKDDILNDIEKGVWRFSRNIQGQIQGSTTLPRIIHVTTADVHRASDQPSGSTEVDQGRSFEEPARKKPFREITKINWRQDHPEAEEFITSRHRELNFAKSKAAFNVIFREGLEAGHWEDTEEWRRKVQNKLTTLYKANVLLLASDTRSLPA